VREVIDALDGARAVLFDVDGTLYRQAPVRRAMVVALARAYVAHPVEGRRVLRTLAAYRKAQESLRAEPVADIAIAQVDLAAARVGTDPAVVRDLVERWMELAPLAAVAAHARPGLGDVLDAIAATGARLGAVSDYPAHRKLTALGVADRFSVVVAAQDPRVDAFKPDPKGLLVALDELGVEPADALYVGDRADVDGRAAAAAGVRYVLVAG
jgi:putative hydrolase of the HAD superfamily